MIKAAMAAVLGLSLSACDLLSAPDDLTDYDYACDVPTRGWASHDTLIYPIEVSPQPGDFTPLRLDTPYDLWCSIRMTGNYAYRGVPMTLVLQQMQEPAVTDTPGSLPPEVARYVTRLELVPEVRDAEGVALGASWGSLVQYEVLVQPEAVRFDSAGTYRLLVTPTLGGGAPLEGLASISFALRRHS